MGMGELFVRGAVVTAGPLLTLGLGCDLVRRAP